MASRTPLDPNARPPDSDGVGDRAEAERDAARAMTAYVARIIAGEPTAEICARNPELVGKIAAEVAILDEIGAVLEPRESLGRLGELELVRYIGGGGMGSVFEAIQPSLGRRVAVKVLPASYLADARAVERFHREPRILGSLRHPNIVAVHTTGKDKETPYFVMELVPGMDLQAIQRRMSAASGRADSNRAEAELELCDLLSTVTATLTRSSSSNRDPGSTLPRLSASAPRPPFKNLNALYCLEMARAFIGAADALHHAHENGVMHRDLKPSNLMLDTRGRLRLLDFGLARVEGQSALTESSGIIGTLPYMSPEQAAGRVRGFSPESDVYGLGATLYSMLAWRAPLTASNAAALADKIQREEPRPLRRCNKMVPLDLETIVMHCLRKDPRQRYRSAEELALDLTRFVEGKPIKARPVSLPVRLVRRTWRERNRIVGVAAALIVVLTTLNVFVFGPLEKREEARRDDYVSQTEKAVAKHFEGQIAPLTVGASLGPAEQVDLQARNPGPLYESQDDGGSDALRDGGVALGAGADLGGAAEDAARESIRQLDAALLGIGDRPDAYYHRARCCLTLNDRERAKEDLEQALHLDPGFVPARVLLRLEWGAGDTPPAPPTPLESMLFAAKQAEREQDWQRAAAAYDLLGANISSEEEPYAGALMEALIGAGVARYRAGELEGALVAFGAAKKQRAPVLPALFIGAIQLRKGKPAEAERVFRAAYDAAEGNRRPEVARSVAAIHRSFASFQRALEWTDAMTPGPERTMVRVDCLRGAGEIDRAVLEAQEGSRAYSKEPGIHIALGQALAARALRDGAGAAKASAFAPAILAHEHAVALSSASAGPHIALAGCQELSGDQRAAVVTLQLAAVRHRSSTAVRYNLAKLLAGQARFEEAKAMYRQVIALEDGHALAWNNLGTLLDRERDVAGAFDAYRRAVSSAPDLGVARFNLGWALHRQRRFADALVEYRKAMALGEDDVHLLKNLVPCLWFRDGPGDRQEAARTAQSIVLEDPTSASTYHNLGVCLYHLGRYEDARDAYKRAVELEPTFATAHSDLGQTFEVLGDMEQAIVSYRTAIRVNPRFIHAHNNLAALLLRLHTLGRPLPHDDELRDDVRQLEDTEGRLSASHAISWLLGRYRQALSPELASYASVDALFEGPVPLLEEGVPLRILRGAMEPPEDWAQPSFDDAAWEPAVAPVGYPREEGVATVLDGMKGAYSTVYLRARFTVADPERIEKLLLCVRVDDAFVAHVNGQEVGRWSAGDEAKPFHDATAAHNLDYTHWRAVSLEVPTRFLNPGENVVAVQGLNWMGDDVDFVLSPIVGAVLRLDPSRLDQLQSAYEAFIADAARVGRDATSIAAYFEARLLERRDDPGAAEARLRTVLENERARAEPALALARLLRSRNELPAAESLLRHALSTGAVADDRLWTAWYAMALNDLHRLPSEIRNAFPPLPWEPRGEPEGRASRAADLRWLTDRLAARDPLRINCGGREHEDANGDSWSQDRFFLAGWPNYLGDIDAQPGIEQTPAMYLTARTFYEDAVRIQAYSIPLPAATYHVTVHFVEGQREEAGLRRFDVLLEGNPVPGGFVPFAADFGAPLSRSSDVVVDDGALDLEMVRGVGWPQLAGLEIERR